MKKILIADESSLFREYLATKLEGSFEVVQATNGLDLSIKMRNEIPDLIIMEFYLSRKSSMEVLQEKKSNPNTANIPIVIVSSKIEAASIKEIVKFGVKKVFSKPIKIDALLNTVSSLLHVNVAIDDTPCIIEAHFNDEILFIEISQGLNTEKIELLKYKITELLELYQVQIPKMLIMMSNIELGKADTAKMNFLFKTVIEEARTRPKFIKSMSIPGLTWRVWE